MTIKGLEFIEKIIDDEKEYITYYFKGNEKIAKSFVNEKDVIGIHISLEFPINQVIPEKCYAEYSIIYEDYQEYDWVDFTPFYDEVRDLLEMVNKQ